MFFVDLLFALILALIITGIFVLALRTPGPWGLWWVFLLVIFLAAWAGGLWITPFGPMWGTVSWLPFLITGLLVALILAAASPPRQPRTPRQAIAQERAEEAAFLALNVFFWVLVVGLGVAIILAYL
jgi:hypothetical protein